MQPGRAWMVSSFSLAVSYAIASLIPMNQWIGFLLRGSFYAAYQLFLSGRSCHLALCWQCSIIKDRSRFSQWPCGGAVLGYVAGLVALLLQPLAQPDGLHFVCRVAADQRAGSCDCHSVVSDGSMAR